MNFELDFSNLSNILFHPLSIGKEAKNKSLLNVLSKIVGLYLHSIMMAQSWRGDIL